MPAVRQAASAKRAQALTETLEDYLETVYLLSRSGGTVRVRDIARARSVRMPTVVIALRRLAEKGYLRYSAGDFAALTRAGETRGRRIAARHAFLQRFLRDVLGLPDDAAAREACGLEHHLSRETLERLAAFVDFLDDCPVGGEPRGCRWLRLEERGTRGRRRRFAWSAWARRLQEGERGA